MSVHHMTKSVGCKTEACKKHGEYESEPFKSITGRVFYTNCPSCDAEARTEREEIEKKEEERLYYNRLTCAGISKRFINSTLDVYKPVNKKASSVLKVVTTYHDNFQKIKDTGSSLVLCGRPGTGKTHLANAMAISLINHGISVLYTTSFRMMARIKSTYSKYNETETESGVIKDFTRRDLLIVDEVGVQFGSDAEKVLFYQIINGRYDNVLPTVLISNLTAKELEQFIGERCFDRLKEGSGAVLSFDWESFRK